MIRKENLEAMIKAIGYIQSSRSKVFEKKYSQFDCAIEVDFMAVVQLIIQKIRE